MDTKAEFITINLYSVFKYLVVLNIYCINLLSHVMDSSSSKWKVPDSHQIKVRAGVDITVCTFLKTAKAPNDAFVTFEDEQKAHLISAEAWLMDTRSGVSYLSLTRWRFTHRWVDRTLFVQERQEEGRQIKWGFFKCKLEPPFFFRIVTWCWPASDRNVKKLVKPIRRVKVKVPGRGRGLASANHQPPTPPTNPQPWQLWLLKHSANLWPAVKPQSNTVAFVLLRGAPEQV